MLDFDRTYEERLTLWQAEDFDAAISLAEQDARDQPECSYTGLAQAFQLDDEPGHGAEVFSLMRDSGLPPNAYLNAYFDTGRERQQ